MDTPLQLGLYATDGGGELVLHITVRVVCEEHGYDYLVKEARRSSLGEAPTVFDWASSVARQAAEEDLCCPEGWSSGTALALPKGEKA